MGEVSEPLELGEGQYFVKLEEKATRPLDPDQIPTVRATAFDTWYAPKKEAAMTDGTIVLADAPPADEEGLEPRHGPAVARRRARSCSLIRMERVLDELRTRFGVSAAEGVQLLTPAAVLRRPFDPGMAAVLLPEVIPALTSKTPKRHVASSRRPCPGATPTALMPSPCSRALYPAGHPVHGLGGAPDTTIGELTPDSLVTGARYLPALEPLANSASPYGLPWLVARLRAPDGCPWDREQNHRSLRKFLLEESYEVYDALDAGSTPAAGRGARRPAAADRAPRPVRGGGRRVRHDRRASIGDDQDRPPPPARLRRRGRRLVG